MDPMIIAYNDDIIAIKVKNGFLEGWVYFFGDPNEIDWYKNLKNREYFVFDNSGTSSTQMW